MNQNFDLIIITRIFLLNISKIEKETKTTLHILIKALCKVF